MIDLKARWSNLCGRLGCPPDEAEWIALRDLHSASHRHYHTLQHLQECLLQLALPELAEASSEPWLELALWYHDAVYSPWAGDNEEKSAQLAERWLAQQGIAHPSLVRELILATRHQALPEPGLQAWMVDIDLSILGAAPERFQQYEEQVRREYRWVPWFLYRKKRREILESFLNRPRLYSNESFHERLDGPARSNLAASLARLQ